MKVVSGRHLCKVLERHGWILQRIHGSHHIYSQPGNPAILTVPVRGNKDLKRGLLRQLLKDSGLADADL